MNMLHPKYQPVYYNTGGMPKDIKEVKDNDTNTRLRIEEAINKLNQYYEQNIELQRKLHTSNREKHQQFRKYHDLNMKRYNAINMIEDLLIDLQTSYILTDREGLQQTFEKLKRTLEEY